MVAPVLEDIANERAGVMTVAKVNVDANPASAPEFQLISIPTLVMFTDGKPSPGSSGPRVRLPCSQRSPTSSRSWAIN
jgi:thioredoxin-like negative regulator of GroEL